MHLQKSFPQQLHHELDFKTKYRSDNESSDAGNIPF